MITRLVRFATAAFTLVSSVQAGLNYETLPFVPVTSTPFELFNGSGQSADYARKVVVSQSGRVYLMGQSVDVGVQNRLFIRCYQADGALIWSDLMELNGFTAHDLLVDANDNAFAIGQVFGRGGLVDSQDVAIIKYNADGVRAREGAYELDYMEPLVDPSYNQNAPAAAAFAPNGKLYISGFVSNDPWAEPTDVSHPYLFAVDTSGSMNLDWTSDIHAAFTMAPVAYEVPVSIAVNASSEVFEVSNYGAVTKGFALRKVTATGDNAWSDSVKIPEFTGRHHEAVHVGVDVGGNVFVTGWVIGDSDNPQPFVARFNAATGAVVWVRTLALAEYSEIKMAKVLSDGSVIGVGSANFGQEWLIFNVGNDGNLKWEQRFSYDTAYNLETDAEGNVYVVGVLPGHPRELGVVKLSASGQLLWTKSLTDGYGLDETDAMPPTIAVDTSGAVYVTAHRNFAMSVPDEFGAAYSVYDAQLFKLQPSLLAPPTLRFVTPLEGQTIAAGSPFPQISIEASSSVGIQKIAIYDGAGRLRAVLSQAPYEITLNGPADLALSSLVAIVYDNNGYAGLAKLSTDIETSDDIIELSKLSYSISESEERMRVTAHRSKISGSASVTLTMTPGTASQADFSYNGGHDPIMIYFGEGESAADAVIDIEADTEAEQDETFTVTLSEPTAGALGSARAATVTIVDNDSGQSDKYGAFEFTSFGYFTTESDGSVELTVVRSGANDSAASVDYATQRNSAVDGSDYLETRGTLEFAPGEISKTFTVHVLNDAEVEEMESFYAQLEWPQNGASLGAKWYTLAHIQANGVTPQPTTISFDSASALVPESKSPLLLIVRRQGNAGATASVAYSTKNGAALSGSDYTEATGAVTFLPQETIKSIAISITGDSTIEADEDFSVQLSAAVGATLGANANVVVTIMDDDEEGESIADWRQTVFTQEELANPAISGDAADPDGDQFSNFVEYALGLDPKASNSENPVQSSFTLAPGKIVIELSFIRPKGRNDIDYIFESFSTLGAEPCLTCVDITVTDAGGGMERVTANLETLIQANTKSGFVRFYVTKKD